MSRFIKSVSAPFTKRLPSGELVKFVTVARGDTEDSLFEEREDVNAGGEFDPTQGNKNYNPVADAE